MRMVDVIDCEGGGGLAHKHLVLHLAQLLVFSVLLFPGVAEVSLNILLKNEMIIYRMVKRNV